MDFDLTEEQRLLQESLARLLGDRYGFEQRKGYMASPEGWSREMWSSYAELGLLGLPFTEEEGGFGGGAVEAMLVAEQMGRAITLVESTLPADQALAQEVLQAVLPHTGRSLRVGITGVPGVGKSTFIEALGRYLVETLGKKLAVLAVDPSSQRGGGSILGVALELFHELALDSRALVRPPRLVGVELGLHLADARFQQDVLVDFVGGLEDHLAPVRGEGVGLFLGGEKSA